MVSMSPTKEIFKGPSNWFIYIYTKVLQSRISLDLTLGGSDVECGTGIQ